MFNFIEQPGRFDLARKGAMFLISTVLHLAAIFILVLLPLIFIGALPEVELLSFLIAAPAPPPGPLPPTPPVAVERHAAQTPTVVRGFEVPPSIPRGVSAPDAEPMPENLGSTPGIGIPGPVASGPGVPGSELGAVVWEHTAPLPTPPPPPKPKQKEAVRRGGEVQQSKLIRRVEPVYPEIAIRARVSGEVILDVKVDEEGNVESVRVLSGHPLLVGAAVSAVSQWKYSPTILNGEPVPVVAAVKVIFTLH